MLAGHLGVGLAAARLAPQVNPGVFILAALWLDLALWSFVLLGWESVAIPADFGRTHQAEFVFPYSHGLAAGLAWSALAGVLARAILGAQAARAPVWIAAAVFSHWLLDALVHRPELPLAGAAAPHVGLALWDHLAAGLAFEAMLTLAGLAWFLSARTLPRRRAALLGGTVLFALAGTVAGMTLAPPPPSAEAMAASSLATVLALCAVAGWCGRRPDRIRVTS